MKKLILAAFIGFGSFVFAQQTTQFSQYMNNQYLINPAAAGMINSVEVKLGGRMQWVGFEGSPKSTFLTLSTVLKKKKGRAKFSSGTGFSSNSSKTSLIKTGKLKHAVGGIIIADEYGAYRQFKASGTYSIHLPLSREYNMSLGVNVGVSNRSFLNERAQTLNVITGFGEDDAYNQYSSASNTNTLDVGVGFHLYSKELFFGVSVDQLTKDLVSFGAEQTTNFDTRSHFRGILGYKFKMDRVWSITPSVLAKYLFHSPLSIEGSILANYKNWLWFGVSYRSKDAVVGLVGLNISQKFKLGYSFDYSVSKLNSHNKGGHEVTLGLVF